MSRKKKPLISIVIPVYNAEKYLNECIESIVAQDIGFEKNIELVLVNDGSIDDSGAVCEKYEKAFPENVIYVKQKNAGAAEARNTGVRSATGEFIGFIDADDFISKDTVKAAMEYFKTAPVDVDIAIVRVILFGVRNMERKINKKFDQGTRTIDLTAPNWYDVCPRAAPTFIRSMTAKKHTFDKRTRFYEDSRYVGEVLSRSMKIGVVADGAYYNRKHDETDTNASITTGATNEKRFYLDSPEHVSLYLLEKTADKNGIAPLYFQYLALYEIRWRMFFSLFKPQDVLSDKEYSHYKKINEKILSYISDKAIIDYKGNQPWQRVHLLSLKHQKNILKESVFNKKGKLTWEKLLLFNHKTRLRTYFSDVYAVNDTLVLKGYIEDFIDERITVQTRINRSKCLDLEVKENQLPPTRFLLEKEFYKRTVFSARVPIQDKLQHIDFVFTVNGKSRRVRTLKLDRALVFRGLRTGKSFIRGDYIIKIHKEKLSVAKNTRSNQIKLQIETPKHHLLSLVKRN